jgi:hypothetical protein
VPASSGTTGKEEMMDEKTINALTEQFRTELRNAATRQPRFQEIVKASLPYSKMKSDDGLSYYLQIIIPLKIQIGVTLNDILHDEDNFVRYAAERMLDGISKKCFEMGMQTNPIEEKYRGLELKYSHSEWTPMGGAREIITLPIAVHPSVQKGQMVMNPADYIRMIRYSDCTGETSAIIKRRN